jgi:hypothetical protein
VTVIHGPRIAENWTSAAGALEGILGYLGAGLPRHAVMGLTGHAWHLCLGTREGVVALPSGPVDLDWEAMVARYARTGWRWERFAAEASQRAAAVAWALAHLSRGRPLIGWDFHLHEFAVVRGFDEARRAWLVDDLLSADYGPSVGLDEWPSLGRIELFAPVEAVEVDGLAAVEGALETAITCFAGEDGSAVGQPRGTAALEAWAEALEGDTEVDRAGNAYTLAVLQAARADGALFVADIAAAIPELAGPLRAAEMALREETKALAPLLTLFPFPSGGHGNVSSPGLRQAAAVALRRAASHERRVAEAFREALALLRS